MTDNIPTPESISHLAQTQASVWNEQQAARAEEAAAEAALLTAAIAAAKPGLRAVSDRIKVHERVYWIDSARTRTEESYSSLRGVRISGEGPERDRTWQWGGTYSGTDIYVLVDGSLLAVSYEGSWSQEQGTADRWAGSERTITAAEAIELDELDDMLTALAKALEQPTKGRLEAAKRSRERADQLRAIATLAR